MQNYDRDFTTEEIILLGEDNTGKTSIIEKYLYGNFRKDCVSTTGIDLYRKEENSLRLKIWDTAGTALFHSILCCFLQYSSSVIIVYDITNVKSFKKVKWWINFLKKLNFNPEKPVFIVGNKSDEAEMRQVNYLTAWKFSQKHGAFLYEVSAKTGENISSLIKSITQELNH